MTIIPVDVFAATFALAAAPAAGSFAATAVHRLPLGETLAGRSHCPHCRARLAWRELLPLVSWLVQRGRCRHCGGPIAFSYLLIETAAIVVALWAATRFHGIDLLAFCLLAWSLLVLAMVDVRHFVLPDVVTLPLVAGGLLFSAAQGPTALANAAIGAAAGFASFAAVAWLYRRWRRRDGLGLGDAKLLAVAGAWLGWAALPAVVLLASLAALAVVLGRRALGEPIGATTAVAFGAYLAAGTWLVALYGPAMVP